MRWMKPARTDAMPIGPQFELRLVGEVVSDRRNIALYSVRGSLPAPGWTAGKVKRPKPVKAGRPLLPRGVTAEDAFRLTVMQCKWHIVSNTPAVVDARDPEGLHQMRVALRRFRVALTSFGGEFRNPVTEALRLRAKQISERLAPARDFDVFLDELFEPAARANGAKEAFEVLRARAKSGRNAAWEEAVAQAVSPTFSAFQRDIAEMINRRVWSNAPSARSDASKGAVAFEAPARDLADRMLQYRLDDAKRRARRLESLSDEERHRLRIALKKLRYTVEFFAPLYIGKSPRKFLKRLSKMQDILGTLNDVVTARETLEQLVAEGDGGPLASRADLSFAAGIAYGWQLERAASTWKDSVGRWKEFMKARPFWDS
jgi:triphosphatase